MLCTPRSLAPGASVSLGKDLGAVISVYPCIKGPSGIALRRAIALTAESHRAEGAGENKLSSDRPGEMGRVSFPCGQVKGLANWSDLHTNLLFGAYHGEMQGCPLPNHADSHLHTQPLFPPF